MCDLHKSEIKFVDHKVWRSYKNKNKSRFCFRFCLPYKEWPERVGFQSKFLKLSR